MAKLTLLDIVQQILSEADGDDVNSITDTVESDQCARIVRDAFDRIVDLHDFEHTKTLKQLQATTSSTPNVMIRPVGFYAIEWIRYDKRTTTGDPQNYEKVDYMEVDAFIDRVSKRTTTDANVTAVTLSTGHVIPVVNNQAPTFYTIMDDGGDEIVFDSYDVALETNLQTSKSLAYGMVKPTLALSDGAVMVLPKNLQGMVKIEAMAMYFDLYKDGITPEIDRARRRSEVRAQRLRNITQNSDNDNRPNYGRK